ncbi:MAG: MCE family protein [Bdellovibrionaceae bacterium]|nr:MCE family protein [Pseudobdellovibrionaceae bacterium]
MNLLRAAEFKVGALVLGVATLIAVMSVQVSDNPSFLGRSKKAHFLMADAGGLVKGSQIKTAGIPVGTISNISLEDGMARVDLSFKRDTELTVSAAVVIKSAGILGDKYIDVYPGSPTDPPLEDGGRINNIKDKGSLDSVISSVGDIANSLKDVSANLKEAVSEDGSRKHVLGRIILNIEKVTQDLSEITSQNKGKVNEIVDQVHGITKTLDEILNDPSDKGFKKRWAVALDRIDSSLKNIDEITTKINNGEGTIGKLVSDEATAEKVENAIDSVNEFLGGAATLQTGLDFKADYLANIGKTKTQVGIRLQPGLDRYYYIGVVDDPAGVVETTDIKTTTSTGESKITEEKTYHNELKFNLIFAKNFYDLTVRGGIMENSGGVGFDYTVWNQKLKFTLDLFDFTNLNVRTQVQYNIWKGIYLSGGVTDMLNKGQKYSNYLGAGLLLTNDDLKLLMTKVPM